MLKKEKETGCNCIKKDVCPYYNNITNAISSIVEMRFGGGPDEIYDKVIKLVEKTCKYREQNKKRWETRRKSASPRLPITELKRSDLKKLLGKKK